MSAPKLRRFVVQLEVEVTIAQTLLDDVLTEGWREMFYGDITTPQKVAEHLAFNLVQERCLSSLDGFADQPMSAAVISESLITTGAVETTPTPKKRPRHAKRQARTRTR